MSGRGDPRDGILQPQQIAAALSEARVAERVFTGAVLEHVGQPAILESVAMQHVELSKLLVELRKIEDLAIPQWTCQRQLTVWRGGHVVESDPETQSRCHPIRDRAAREQLLRLGTGVGATPLQVTKKGEAFRDWLIDHGGDPQMLLTHGPPWRRGLPGGLRGGGTRHGDDQGDQSRHRSSSRRKTHTESIAWCTGTREAVAISFRIPQRDHSRLGRVRRPA